MSVFGNETLGASKALVGNYILGSWFTCPTDGTADSITAYVDGASRDPFKCAIYRKDNNRLVGVTEEITLEEPLTGWLAFNFSEPKPTLASGTDYFLVCWGRFSTQLLYFDYTGKSGNQHISYGAWPDPWSPIIAPEPYTKNYSIFCTYTPVAIPPPQDTLTISSTAGGTTDPAPGAYLYPVGTVVGVTAIPDAGYLFDHWELDGVARTENPVDVLIGRDHTLHAVFVEAPPVPPPSKLDILALGLGLAGVVGVLYYFLKK